MIKKIVLSVLIICIFSSCGYSRLDKLISSNYKISEINISGDKNIAYPIKNELRLFSDVESSNNIYLDLIVNSQKKISEKNEKNQITKYSLEINAAIILKDQSRNILAEENFNIKDNYKVEDNSINTQNNQKKLKERLIKKISTQINIFITQYYN
tara:strand:+ start:47 stop:511 length:465 start_codon:yes stop_codon:yes gene_type:complete